MTRWVRFSDRGTAGFGTLDEHDLVHVHTGDMFGPATPTGRTMPLTEVEILPPTTPGKMLALWNNFHALADKLQLKPPSHPLYFVKTGNSFAATGGAIRRPPGYRGRIIYEGELGIVIGRRCAAASQDEAEAAIFGYTCVNDVTAADLLNEEPSFAQWVRAKSFDTFGPFGPTVSTGLRTEQLVVRTVLNGQERQNYPVSDMIHPPRAIVSLISHDMTLDPGDVICCGTSLGAGTMKEPRNIVEVSIDGVGTLRNTFEQ
jgi:2-keto-4-pentenoate hydratase/2-oxohepta-3-ene-1,7-dioic acid hydratase in catechol pathway